MISFRRWKPRLIGRRRATVCLIREQRVCPEAASDRRRYTHWAADARATRGTGKERRCARELITRSSAAWTERSLWATKRSRSNNNDDSGHSNIFSSTLQLFIIHHPRGSRLQYQSAAPARSLSVHTNIYAN